MFACLTTMFLVVLFMTLLMLFMVLFLVVLFLSCLIFSVVFFLFHCSSSLLTSALVLPPVLGRSLWAPGATARGSCCFCFSASMIVLYHNFFGPGKFRFRPRAPRVAHAAGGREPLPLAGATRGAMLILTCLRLAMVIFPCQLTLSKIKI